MATSITQVLSPRIVGLPDAINEQDAPTAFSLATNTGVIISNLASLKIPRFLVRMARKTDQLAALHAAQSLLHQSARLADGAATLGLFSKYCDTLRAQELLRQATDQAVEKAEAIGVRRVARSLVCVPAH